MKRREIDEIDKAVSAEIRRRRIAAGMTQSDLAAALGCSYQQVHKFENGITRMRAGQVWLVARALGCGVADLFPPMQSDLAAALGDPLKLKLLRHASVMPLGPRNAIAGVVRRMKGDSL